MARLTERVAIVTGGAAGIGEATCRRFAEEGAAVVIADVNLRGEQLAHEIRAAGGRALFVRTDVSVENDARELARAATREFGRVHILVNNAAVFVLKGIEATIEDWHRSLGVNVIGSALVTREVVPAIREAGGGAIVNLGSISSFIAQPQFITYSATKAAIANMTRCMALDLAADNIRVNAVCPGTVWTPTVERLCREQGLDRNAANQHPDWGGAHILGRVADTREIADAILFFVSDEASFITGECLMVDGGYTTR